MRSRALAVALAAVLWPVAAQEHGKPARRADAGEHRSSITTEYRVALPGYIYRFPRDHFNHPEFRTEWWYYTGNLRSRDGRGFGFELTFFRHAVSRQPAPASPWEIQDLYLAHFALSDLDGGAFHHEQRVNRGGPGLAGASEDLSRVWNGNWRVRWEGENQYLEGTAARFAIRLGLRPEKPPVINGLDGVSQKAAGRGRASHYISLTRLAASGSIEIDGRRSDAEGSAWMDHEFFTHQLEQGQAGWDWFSIQLDDGTDLMLYRLRRADGSADPFSAGTVVDARGAARHLPASAFTLQPAGRTWRSPDTGGVYPLEWRIAVPSLDLSLEAATPLDEQEIVSRHRSVPSYWEGAIRLSGRRGSRPVAGVGYLEMTGYDSPVSIGARSPGL